MPENGVKPNDPIQLRSESVQEILTAPPGWMISWGNMVILLLIAGFLLSCWFIKYPDVIRTEITVTTAIPPGNIFLDKTIAPQAVLIKNNDPVHKGQPLIVLEKAGNYQDILLLKGLLDTLDINDASLSTSLSKLPALNLGEAGPFLTLFKRDVFAFMKDRSSRKAMEDMIDSHDKLKKSLDAWEVENIIKSPIDGRILFSDRLINHQNINKGNLVATIIPEGKRTFIGKAKISPQQVAKIQSGQRVIISLSAYPASLYGTIEGVVDEVSATSDEEGQYNVKVKLDETLRTSQDKNIAFKQEMPGTAKIITEDLRLIERFFQKLRILNW